MKQYKRIGRVCMVNPQGYMTYPPPLGKTDTGGQTLYILQLARALAKKNIKVDILTRKFDNFPEEEQVSKNVRIVRMPCGGNQFVPKERMYELIPEFIENFIQYVEKKRKKYDLVHSHYWDGGYSGILLSKLIDVPHVHTPHSLGKLKKLDLSVEKLPPQKLKPVYRYHMRIAIEQKILNKAHAVIALCETSRIQLLQHYIIDFEKIKVIFPGVDISVFNPQRTKYDQKIKLVKNAILTVSRVVPAKGLDRVIDALALIKSKIPFHLYVGGGSIQTTSTEERAAQEQLRQLIKKHRLENRVTMIGFVDHNSIIPAFYRGANIFILASRYEPFGLTTLEAMACKTAPIISHVAGSREVIVDGLNGFIVDTQDRKALANIIFMLLKNEKLRKKVSENAYFTIKEHYAWDKIVEKIIAVYKNLL